MTIAYITLVVITAIISILLTFRYITPSKTFMRAWLVGVALGILLFIYVQLPLMEWSTFLTITFWIATIIQLIGALIWYIASFAPSANHTKTYI